MLKRDAKEKTKRIKRSMKIVVDICKKNKYDFVAKSNKIVIYSLRNQWMIPTEAMQRANKVVQFNVLKDRDDMLRSGFELIW